MLSAESASPTPLFHLCGMPWPQVRMRCSHTSALAAHLVIDSHLTVCLPPLPRAFRGALGFGESHILGHKMISIGTCSASRPRTHTNEYARLAWETIGYTMWCDIFAAMCTTWAAPREDEAGQKAQIKLKSLCICINFDTRRYCCVPARTADAVSNDTSRVPVLMTANKTL